MTQRLGDTAPRPHPRTLGWIGTTALAMGGSNQSLFLLGALVASQGSAAIPLLFLGLLLSWAAAFGWTELVLMFPDRVGGIAASCAEAFRPYSPVLSTLTGVCYWWGWVPTCGLTAILSASAITQWYLPDVPVAPLAIGLVVVFTLVNLAGVRWVTRLAVPIAAISAGLALVSGLAPVLSGTVDWQLASSFHLISPFAGLFGDLTSAMAGLYLIGFAAPAFEAAACHVGETVDPKRNVPRAMLASGAMAAVYFVLLPVIWLGVLGPETLQEDLAQVLGPTFAPVFGSAARAAAIGFMMLNMFHGTLQPLAGASRTLMQLAEDGLLPRLLALRSRADVPWVATLLTALVAVAFLLAGDPTWLIAAANLAYLVGIGLPSVAVWLLRRDAPHLLRPYRAPRGTIQLGLLAAVAWGVTCLLGFQQFGLPTVIVGLMLCYSGAGLYAYRRMSDRRRLGLPGVKASLHLKLTGAMLLVMVLDGAGYLLAVDHVDHDQAALVAALEDIFVAVALLTVSVGLVLPGMIAHAAEEIARAADHLATGTLADLVRGLQALGVGDLDAAHVRVDVVPVVVHTGDELGAMAASFNIMQDNVASAAIALDGAREGLRHARTDLESSHTTLGAREERYRLALQAASMGTWDWDVIQDVHTWSVETEALSGLAPGTFDGTFAAFHRAVHPDDWLAIGLEEQAAQAEHRDSITAYRTVWPDGTVRWIESKGRALYASDGTLARLTGTSVDITERKQAEEALRHQALHDGLTGLPNRTLLQDRVSQAILAAERANTPLTLLLVDLDRFKEINDTFGHHYGDLLLQQIGPRLRGVLRAADTVARLGGDEFGILLPTTDAGSAFGVAQQLVQMLESPFELDGQTVEIGASIGVASYPAHGSDTATLLRQADVAMYVAKRGGIGIVVYTAEQDHYSAESLALGGELRRAIDNCELLLHFQPKLNLRDGALVGVEALVRWQHPLRGFLPPSEFIPLAEQNGLIYALTQWVLEAAVQQQQAWREMGLDIPVAVNLSRRTLHDPRLPGMVSELLARYALPSSALVLEITESSLMADPVRATENLTQLRAQGVQMSIDDFGTGYSSLDSLKDLSVDELKIDRSFVQAMATDARARAIVRAIIDLADALQLRVVAEGVEDRATWDVLAGLGCEVAQGYFLCRPIAATELEVWIAEMSQSWLDVAQKSRVDDAIQGRIRGRGARLTAEEEFVARKQAEAALSASEERNRLALQAAGMGTWDVDIILDTHTWSVETEALFGLAPGTFEGTFAAYRRLVHPADWLAVETELLAAQVEHRDFCATYRVVWPDGSVHWIEERGRPLHNAEGTLVRMTGTSMDIAKRKEAEAALCASEERNRMALEAARMGTWDWDVVNDVHTWSTEAEALSGLAPGTFDGTFEAMRRVVHPDDWPSFEIEEKAAQAEGRDSITTYRTVWPDGSLHWLESKGRSLYAADGALVRMTGTAMDITERKWAEAALHASEERNRLALEAAGMGTWDFDPIRDARTWSAETEALHGLAPGTFEGTFAALERAVHPDDWPALEVELQAAQAERRPSIVTYRTVWPDGTMRWLENHGRSTYAGDGTLLRRTGTCLDITERKGNEEALRASEERFRKQYKGIPLPTYSWLQVGDDFVLEDCNDAAEANTEGPLADWLGSRASERYADRPEILSELHACLTEQRTIRHERQHRYRSTGQDRHLAFTYVFIPPRTVMVHREDITEAKQAEQQREALVQSEKLRALGQMATGIAHDLNQSLMLVASYSDLARQALVQTPPNLVELEDLVDLSRVVRDAAQLTAPRWRDEAQAEGRPIRLHLEAEGNPTIQGSAARLRELMTNLIFNAVDALPSGGTIRLRVAAHDGQGIVEVNDSGVGMSAETQARAFELFFTTKGEGGAGLGLAMVFGIVEQHGGRIEVRSAAGDGTTFRITFPLVEASAEAVPTLPLVEIEPARPLRVLTVDDEPLMTRAVVYMLKPSGHVVTTAASGEEALERLAGQTFDVVVSDVGMGSGMSGWELADEVKRRWPSVRFLLATGWGAAIDASEARARGVEAVLSKPYHPVDLLEALARPDAAA